MSKDKYKKCPDGAIPLIRSIYDDMSLSDFTSCCFKDTVSLTEQDQADAADINNIIATHARNHFAELPTSGGHYGDAINDYYDTLCDLNSQKANAQDAFDNLPDNVRSKYGTLDKLSEAMNHPDFQAQYDKVKGSISKEHQDDAPDASADVSDGDSEESRG